MRKMLLRPPLYLSIGEKLPSLRPVALRGKTLASCVNKTRTVVKVPLTRGKSMLVDLQDFHKICDNLWTAVTDGHNFYARNHDKGTRSAHRVILGCDESKMVDHINGNSLDNRRVNLRYCTMSQNIANSKHQKNTVSGLRGVSGSEGKWIARIGHPAIHLGFFKSKFAAARAYDTAAQEKYGEFARLNYPSMKRH